MFGAAVGAKMYFIRVVPHRRRQVWEGINATVNLTAGTATVSLTVHRDTDSQCAASMLGYCQYADRNIDAIMLMPNRTDIEHRWNSSDPGVMAFDGLFSQAVRPVRLLEWCSFPEALWIFFTTKY